MPVRSTRTQKLDLRISPEAKDALARAAALSRRSLSDFVLESALARADETLADRRRFVLNADQWEEFVAALDAPPTENPALKRLLAGPDIFARP